MSLLRYRKRDQVISLLNPELPTPPSGNNHYIHLLTIYATRNTPVTTEPTPRTNRPRVTSLWAA